MQSRRASVIEAATSTIVGCVAGLVTNYLVMPHYGVHIGLMDNVSLTGIFTMVSFVKSYVVRRSFANFRGMKS
ncbi:hypothetical protein DIE09_06510 [Burkholderia sp. Bp9010]|nr:hypothetical protein DIE10_06330 [Burkholderia sp. Bp9011]RQR97044.1 hypothetical protein DIE09_06510 [Burkholderia sp. Bp9010]